MEAAQRNNDQHDLSQGDMAVTCADVGESWGAAPQGLQLKHQCRNELHSRQQPVLSSPGPGNRHQASQRIYDASGYGASDRRQPMHHATPT
eukprot:2063457-Rhodomonas_salina.1